MSSNSKHRPAVLLLQDSGPGFLTKKAAIWIDERIKLPNWTKKEIEQMPATDVEGTAVLGGRISVPPRSDLHSIPDIVWQARKDDYTYEGWLDRVAQSLH
jgi:hypothetical protein